MPTTTKFTPTPFWLLAALVTLAIGLATGLLVTRQANRTPKNQAQAGPSQAGLSQANQSSPLQDPVVAMVNDTSIHQSDLRVLSPPVPSQEAIGLLVDFTLLDQEAHKKNITISNAELQQQRLQILTRRGETYTEAAKALGRTPAGLDLQLRHAALLQKLAALEFKSPLGNMFHARGILIRVPGRHAATEAQAYAFAEKLQTQIQDGADITALAKTNSDDPFSAPAGGDLGITQLAGTPNLVRFAPDFKLQKALASAVGTASPGSFLHGPIRGDFGDWVVEVVSTSARPLSDKDHYRAVQGLWRTMWVRRLEPEVMGKLRGNAEIEPPLAAEPQPSPAKKP